MIAREDDLIPDRDGLRRRTFGIGGAALSALTAGSLDGEVMVLLHGIPAGAELWRGAMMRVAAAGLTVVAFDLPGYGATLVPEGSDHSLAGAAELIATWAKVEVNHPVWVVGHDIGGGVAQILATRHPASVARLTLVDSIVEDAWPVPPIRLARRTAPLYPLLGRLMTPNPYFRSELRKGFHDAERLTDEDAERVFWDTKVTSADGRRAFARHLRALDNQQTLDAAGSLTRLTIPTQLVWAEHDTFQPWESSGERLRDLLPEPAVTVVPDAGHYLPLERPDAFAEALLAWSQAR